MKSLSAFNRLHLITELYWLFWAIFSAASFFPVEFGENWLATKLEGKSCAGGWTRERRVIEVVAPRASISRSFTLNLDLTLSRVSVSVSQRTFPGSILSRGIVVHTHIYSCTVYTIERMVTFYKDKLLNSFSTFICIIEHIFWKNVFMFFKNIFEL